ncbi:AMP nucleosidase [Aurantiacibacter suaedae]|uniref:AMP nucleosidase n=1 Tax=Aurantiacibacter suaedae TaxID=2545755 RepID=UPI0010F5B6AC|nr:AMP nucleosidase [Aurantiacibacter suaedae]
MSIDTAAIIDQLEQRYQAALDELRAAVAAYIEDGKAPTAAERAAGLFAYPELRIRILGERAGSTRRRAVKRVLEAGDYAISITRPELFRRYLTSQLDALTRDHEIEVEIATSSVEIPFPYAIDGLDLEDVRPAELATVLPTTELALVGDHVADGAVRQAKVRPLGHFDALRTDFSLARLKHYTGTPPEHFQRYVLFTNYHRYVDAFAAWAGEQLQSEGHYSAFSSAGGAYYERAEEMDEHVADSAWRRHQMPAYHLIAPDGEGISLVNIGVGPSNAKTLTDHLAVLRPEAWIMIGHCGGLRSSQVIGDYVLAHAYLRDDHVLDRVLSPEMPVPPIAEVQQALHRATAIVTGEDDAGVRDRLRTGTIVTTDDRNWELRHDEYALRFNQSRAVAIDMESATIATQGQRFRVPHGTLLCVSDKPLHGEIKLPGQANRFYEQAIREHIAIGIETVAQLRKAGSRLHSRKLRAFDEPPFR